MSTSQHSVEFHTIRSLASCLQYQRNSVQANSTDFYPQLSNFTSRHGRPTKQKTVLWQPTTTACEMFALSLQIRRPYPVQKASATYGTRAKRGTWNDFQWHAE